MPQFEKFIEPSEFVKLANHDLSIWKDIVGQRITEKKFGDGTIIKIEHNFAILVQFDTPFVSLLTNKITDVQQIAPIAFENGRVTRLRIPLNLQEKLQEAEQQKRLQQEVAEQKRTEAKTEKIRRQHEKLWEIQEQERSFDVERQKLKIEHKEQLKDFCSQRNITTVIHFTRIQNLQNILEKGLLDRHSLENSPRAQEFFFNDPARYDECREANCMSISFPNYRMFYKLSHSNQDDWIILLLKSDVIWKLDCAFSLENASSKHALRVPLEKRRQISQFEKMFSDYNHVKRQSLGIPDYYTTNPQAEVLIFELISSSYIKEVHFYTLAAMQRWIMEHPGSYPQKMVYNQTFFSPRSDWEYWRADNSNTPPPPEKIEILR